MSLMAPNLDDRRFQDRPDIGLQAPLAVRRPLQLFGHLVQMELRGEGPALLEKPVGQLLAGHHRKPGNVVDRLFGIQLRALATRLVQDVDQVALHVEKAEFEDREQADGPGADNDHVR